MRHFLLSLLFGFLLLASCSKTHWWEPPEPSKLCDPQTYQTLQKAAIWKNTFGKSDTRGAYGCLQITWGSPPEGGKGLWVQVSPKGMVTAYNKVEEKFIDPISLQLPEKYSYLPRRFRVYIFGKKYQRASFDEQQTFCEQVVAKPQYDCFTATKEECWFYFAFRPKSSDPQRKVLLISEKDTAGCRIITRPQFSEPVADGSSEPPNDAIPDTSQRENRDTPPRQESFPETKTEPQPEQTSGTDGECIPNTQRACYTGKANTRNRGICRDGKQICLSNKKWGTCRGEILPHPEACDQVDNDCDGKIDELPFCQKIACTPPCVVTIAGASRKTMNGNKLSSWFQHPRALVVAPSGDIYVADTGSNTIRKIDVLGQVTTIAGTGTPGFLDGAGSQAMFKNPEGITIDNQGNLYISDTGNNRIRRITPTGQVSTFAGTGQKGFRDGSRLSATFLRPSRIIMGANQDYWIADSGNHAIRKIDAQGNVTTVAGTGTKGFKDGPAKQAQFNNPVGLALAGSELFIADRSNNRIRKVDLNKQVVTTIAGIGKGNQDGVATTQASFDSPRGLVLSPQGDLFIADRYNHVIRRLHLPTNLVSTPVGAKRILGFTDGQGKQALFSYPNDITIDTQGNTYIADTFNYSIRKVDKQKNVITFAGQANFGLKDGPAFEAAFRRLSQVVVDSKGHIFVADTWNHRIRKIDTTGQVSTYAGSGQKGSQRGYRNGDRTQALFNNPYGLAIDKNDNLYVADSGNHDIRKIDRVTGRVSTIAGIGQQGFKDGVGLQASFNDPRYLHMSSQGVLYIADTRNNAIRKLDTKGNVTTVAGTGKRGFQNGPGNQATFYYPTGITTDSKGNIYVSDSSNNCIRKITPKGFVSTFVGRCGNDIGFSDGQGQQARLASPRGITIDSNDQIYFIDYDANSIRIISPTGDVRKWSGGWREGYVDGDPSKAFYSSVRDLTFGPHGQLFVVEDIRIRKIVLGLPKPPTP